MKVKIIKILSFTCILIVSLLVLSKVFYPKNNSVEAGIHSRGASGILAETENTIDVIVVGNSEAYTSIIPMEIWNEYGYTSYVCASPEQSLPQSVRFVNEVCKNQKPKLIILESNNIFSSYKLSEGTDQLLNYKFKIFQYHDRWKTLKKEDFTQAKHFDTINHMKGYEYSDDVMGGDDIVYNMEKSEVGVIPKSNILYLKLINNYCKKNGIKFMILSTPGAKYWNYGNYEAIQNFCTENDIEHLDLNLCSDEINIDWTTDTRDDGNHLNHKGALKTTQYLGKYLSNMGILESHKDDEKYNKWNESYDEYKKISEQ